MNAYGWTAATERLTRVEKLKAFQGAATPKILRLETIAGNFDEKRAVVREYVESLLFNIKLTVRRKGARYEVEAFAKKAKSTLVIYEVKDQGKQVIIYYNSVPYTLQA